MSSFLEIVRETLQFLWDILFYGIRVLSLLSLIIGIIWFFFYVGWEVNFFPVSLVSSLSGIVYLVIVGIVFILIYLLFQFIPIFLSYQKKRKKQIKKERFQFPWKFYILVNFATVVSQLIVYVSISLKSNPYHSLFYFWLLVIIEIALPYILIPIFCDCLECRNYVSSIRTPAIFANLLLYVVFSLFGWQFIIETKGWGFFLIGLIVSAYSIVSACLQLRFLGVLNRLKLMKNSGSSNYLRYIKLQFAKHLLYILSLVFVGIILLLIIGGRKAIIFPFRTVGIGAKYVLIEWHLKDKVLVAPYFSPWVTSKAIIIDLSSPCNCFDKNEKQEKLNEDNKKDSKKVKEHEHIYQILKVEPNDINRVQVLYFDSLEECSDFCKFLFKENPNCKLFGLPVLKYLLQRKASSQSSGSQKISKGGRRSQIQAERGQKDLQGKQERGDQNSLSSRRRKTSESAGSGEKRRQSRTYTRHQSDTAGQRE